MAIPLAKSNLLALVLETLLFGVFLVLFAAAVYSLLLKPSRAKYKMIVTLIAMFVLSTLHLTLDIVRGFNAFVNDVKPSPEEFYLDLADPTEPAKTATYATLTLVGDAFVIYRCYIVWARTWFIVVVPTLLLIADGVLGYFISFEFSQATPGAEVFAATIAPHITAFFSLTLATNVICTSLIAYKIQSTRMRLNGAAVIDPSRSGVTSIVVESAALYSATVLSLLVTYVIGSNAQYVVLDMTSPIIGITFTVIILRVSMGISTGDTPLRPSTSDNGPSRHVTTIGGTRSYDHFQMSRRPPVAVNVSHLVEVDTAEDDVSRGDDVQKRDISPV